MLIADNLVDDLDSTKAYIKDNQMEVTTVRILSPQQK